MRSGAGLHLPARASDRAGSAPALAHLAGGCETLRRERTVHAAQPLVLHLLSNIFDVPGIDLDALARTIARTGREYLVFCAGHYNVEGTIEGFSRRFRLVPGKPSFAEARSVLGILPNAYRYGSALKAFRARQEEDGTHAELLTRCLWPLPHERGTDPSPGWTRGSLRLPTTAPNRQTPHHGTGGSASA